MTLTLKIKGTDLGLEIGVGGQKLGLAFRVKSWV
jgi:hypothetical protein